MRSSIALAALAGVALAAPHYGSNPQHDNNNQVEQVYWVVETIVQTVTVTDDDSQPTATAQQYSVAPIVTSAAAPAYTPTPQAYTSAPYTPAPYTPSAKPTPTPTPSQAAPAPSGTDTGYMAIVNKYRAIMGVPALTQDASLEQNDLSCLQANPGQMQHILNSGSFAQVLAPGTMDDFEHIFVGGWICEVPSYLGGQSGLCTTQSQGWMYDGTGHADILHSTSYTKIGCQCYQGIVGCDLA